MNIQKKDVKLQPESVHKDRGDVLWRRRKEIQGSTPRDRGDANRSKKIVKQSKTKTRQGPGKAESPKVELVTRSTNTLSVSAPASFGSRKNGALSCEKDIDFRRRIKDRYTFKGVYKADTEDIDLNKINDVKKEPPMPSNPESPDKYKSQDLVKNRARTKDKVAVHRAVSAMKLKSKLTLAERIKDTAEKIKSRKDYLKPVIQTVTSKMDKGRVYKAVTFVEKIPRQPLHITIPKDLPSKAMSRIPVSVPKSPSVKRVKKKLQRRSSPICLPEVAQWAPESITEHTMPYYEAWLTKTATASTKVSEEEKEHILRKAMRPRSPVRYDVEDAGKIRVRRKVK